MSAVCDGALCCCELHEGRLQCIHNIELKWKKMETGQLNHNTEPLGVFSTLDFISDTSAVKCAPMPVCVASVCFEYVGCWLCELLLGVFEGRDATFFL